MPLMLASNWQSITNAESGTYCALSNTRNWDCSTSHASASVRCALQATIIERPGWRGRKKLSASGLRGWKEKPRGLLPRSTGMFRRRRSRGPIQSFGESIEQFACPAFHGHATFAKTVKKGAAFQRIELEEIRAPHQVRTLGMFFLERLGILPEETRSVLLVIEM